MFGKTNILRPTGILPIGYTECEYLESTGTQYIDTGFIADANTTMVVEFQATNLSAIRSTCFGSNDYTNNARFCLTLDSTKRYWQFNICNTYLVNTLADVNKHTAEYNAVEHKLILDGREKQTSSIDWLKLNANTFPIHLFAAKGSSNSYSKIYNAQIYESGVLIHNYIPYLDNNDVPCMYDTVSQTTFYNAGTGSFGYKVKA